MSSSRRRNKHLFCDVIGHLKNDPDKQGVASRHTITRSSSYIVIYKCDLASTIVATAVVGLALAALAVYSGVGLYAAVASGLGQKAIAFAALRGVLIKPFRFVSSPISSIIF